MLNDNWNSGAPYNTYDFKEYMAFRKEKKLLTPIFRDPSKLFNILNREILLHKLQYYGIAGVILDWYYSTNRTQYVKQDQNTL